MITYFRKNGLYEKTRTHSAVLLCRDSQRNGTSDPTVLLQNRIFCTRPLGEWSSLDGWTYPGQTRPERFLHPSTSSKS